MNWVLKWREIFLLVFVVLAMLFIHPFNMPGLQISHVEEPATQVLHLGDIVESINGYNVNALSSFEDTVSNINPNDTITVSVLRETFPYSYKKFTESYITSERNNKTWLSFTVKEIQPTNIKLSHELAGGLRYTIAVNGNLDDAINVLSKRFAIGRVSSYSFEKAGSNQLYLYTFSGEEIIQLIESKGNFEAKIGDDVFFNNDDFIKICTSGVSCSISLYPFLNQSQETSQVLWRYGFDVSITTQASQRFANLTKGLSISKCEGDRCLLNETVDYYLDGQKIGSEDIYSDYKGKSFPLPNVGGTKTTKDDASQALYITQAILQGRVNAQVSKVDDVAAAYGPDFLNMITITLIALIVAGSIVVLLQTKDLMLTAVGALLGFAELIFVVGWMSVLNITITSITVVGIITMISFTLGYKIFVLAKIREEGFTKYNINNQSSKLNKKLLIALGVSTALVFILPAFAAPLMFYFVLLITLTKLIFMKSIKATT